MNKICRFSLLIAIASTFLGSLVNQNHSIKAAGSSYVSEYENLPEPGKTPATSYFSNSWYSTVGSRRIDDKAVIAVDTSGWGNRGNIIGRKFNLKNLSFTIDVSKLISGTCMNICFASAEGSYCSENTMVLNIDLMPSPTNKKLILTTLSTTIGHHELSVEGFSDGGVWYDSAFKGVQTLTTDSRVNFKIQENPNNPFMTSVFVNGDEYQLSSQSVFSRCYGGSEAYATIGMFNNDGMSQAFIIEEFSDASDTKYFSSTGAFGITKEGIAYLKSLDLSNDEKVLDAKERLDDLPFDELYSYDKALFQTDFDYVSSVINNKFNKLDSSLVLTLYARRLAKLETAVEELYTLSNIDEAIAASKLVNVLTSSIDEGEFDPETLGLFNSYKARYNRAYKKISVALEEYFTRAVEDIEFIANNIVNGSDINLINKMLRELPISYKDFLTPEVLYELADRIDVIMARLEQLSDFKNPLFDKGQTMSVYSNDDGSYELSSYGNCMGLSNSAGSGLFLKKAINPSDFELVLNFNNIPEVQSGWVSFGILEKPEMWQFKDDQTVQNNKGVFFLVSRINSLQLNVQCFVISGETSSFYGGALSTNLVIKTNQDLHISFTKVRKIIAGQTNESYSIKFGESSFDEENLSADLLESMYPNNVGYFFISSNGFSQDKSACVSLKSINGVMPSLFSDKDTKLNPSITIENNTHTLETYETISMNVDSATSIYEVKIDGVEIKNSYYNVEGKVLTLTSFVLNKLSAGTHTVSVFNQNGKADVNIEIIAPATPKGCASSLISSSSILFIVSLGAILLISLKKKEN